MRIYFVITFLTLSFVSLSAQPRQEQDPNALFFQYLSNDLMRNHFALLDQAPTDQTTGKIVSGPKSIVRGVQLSLILPGSGEIYAKRWWKGLLFLGAEIFGWTSYFIHHSKGQEWKSKYQSFADREWDRERWQSWWNSLSPTQQASFPPLSLPATNNADFYNLIAKYQMFNAGWRDVEWQDGQIETPEGKASAFYLQLRHNSNTEFKLATTSTALILANHVLSALDAAFTVQRFNKKVRTKTRFQYVQVDSQPAVFASLIVAW